MRLVVGWVASYNDLPLDQIDDINLALETLVSGEPESDRKQDALSLNLSTQDGELHVLLQGLLSSDLLANLKAGNDFVASSEWPLDIRIFLRALVDEYGVVGCDETSFGVLMKKRIR